MRKKSTQHGFFNFHGKGVLTPGGKDEQKIRSEINTITAIREENATEKQKI